MQRKNTSPLSLDWTELLRTWPAHQREVAAGDAARARLARDGEQEDRVASSKLERLAAELHALGIRF